MAVISIPLAVTIDPRYKGVYHVKKVREDSKAKVEELLRENHQIHHIFFTRESDFGVYLHNHLVHHALTLYLLGAPPDVIEAHHRANTTYQIPLSNVEQASVIRDLNDPQVFQQCTGQFGQYANWMRFYETKILELGWDGFLTEFLFGGTPRANDMLRRLFAGYLHPWLHFGFAVEFHESAILAEALAMASVHNDPWVSKFLHDADELASKEEDRPATMVELVDLARADSKIRESSNIWFFRQRALKKIEKDHIRDGVIANAGSEVLKLAARWRVTEAEVEAQTAELINAAALICCAAQRPPYVCLYDFFTMHSHNSAIFISAMLRSDVACLASPKNVARMLNALGRITLVLYAGTGCPELNLPYALEHPPKDKDTSWSRVIERATLQQDDGHTSKLVRGLAHGEEVCRKYEGRPEFRVKKDMWLKLANGVIDSTSDDSLEGGYPTDWIRGAGFPEAWEGRAKRESKL